MGLERTTVFTAVRVHTMDQGVHGLLRWPAARIVSVGDFDARTPSRTRDPHEVDDPYRDTVIVAGFIDPHTHRRGSGVYLDLNDVALIESITASGARSTLVDHGARVGTDGVTFTNGGGARDARRRSGEGGDPVVSRHVEGGISRDA